MTQPAFSIAPSLNSGTKSWSYFPNGYVIPNVLWKKSNPWRVTSRISSASRYPASDWRQYTPSGMPSCSPRTT